MDADNCLSLPLSILACTVCKGDLVEERSALVCPTCGRVFPLVLSIPDFRFPSQPKCRDVLSSTTEAELTDRLVEAYPSSNFERLMAIYQTFYGLPGDLKTISLEYHSHSRERGKALSRHIEEIGRISGCTVAGRNVAVDFGCGSGGWLTSVSEGFGRVIGIDPSMPRLLLARKRFEECGCRGIALLCSYGEAVPLKGECADFIGLCDVVEHVLEPIAVLREVQRVLRPGGVAYLNSPNRFSPFLVEQHVDLWGVGLLPRSLAELYVRWRRGISYRNVARILSYGHLMRLVRRIFGNYVYYYAYYEARFRVSHNAKARLLRAVLFCSCLRGLFWGFLRYLRPHFELLIRKGKDAGRPA